MTVRCDGPKVLPISQSVLSAVDSVLLVRVEVSSSRCRTKDESFILVHAFLEFGEAVLKADISEIADVSGNSESRENSGVPESNVVSRAFVCRFEDCVDIAKSIAANPEDAFLRFVCQDPIGDEKVDWHCQGAFKGDGKIEWKSPKESHAIPGYVSRLLGSK